MLEGWSSRWDLHPWYIYSAFPRRANPNPSFTRRPSMKLGLGTVPRTANIAGFFGRWRGHPSYPSPSPRHPGKLMAAGGKKASAPPRLAHKVGPAEEAKAVVRTLRKRLGVQSTSTLFTSTLFYFLLIPPLPFPLYPSLLLFSKQTPAFGPAAPF